MLSVAPVSRQDVPAVAEMLEELDRFYGATDVDPIELRSAQIDGLLFRAQPAAYVLLARDDDEAVGLAAYSFLWPAAGVTQSLYLKELYVAGSHRRRGVGRLLMRRLQEIAAENGCSRVEWTTDRDNPHAQRFYDGLGYVPSPDKVFYRIAPADT